MELTRQSFRVAKTVRMDARRPASLFITFNE